LLLATPAADGGLTLIVDGLADMGFSLFD